MHQLKHSAIHKRGIHLDDKQICGMHSLDDRSQSAYSLRMTGRIDVVAA